MLEKVIKILACKYSKTFDTIDPSIFVSFLELMNQDVKSSNIHQVLHKQAQNTFGSCRGIVIKGSILIN
jgi:hypothetical protein